MAIREGFLEAVDLGQGHKHRAGFGSVERNKQWWADARSQSLDQGRHQVSSRGRGHLRCLCHQADPCLTFRCSC